MIDNEVILKKFEQYRLNLSHKQIRDIKNENVSKVLDEHSQHAKELMKRGRFSIIAGLILLTIAFYLVTSSNLDSLIPSVCSGLGAASLTWGSSAN